MHKPPEHREEHYEDVLDRARDPEWNAAFVDRENFEALHYACPTAEDVAGRRSCRCGQISVNEMGRIWLKSTPTTMHLLDIAAEMAEMLE